MTPTFRILLKILPGAGTSTRVWKCFTYNIQIRQRNRFKIKCYLIMLNWGGQWRVGRVVNVWASQGDDRRFEPATKMKHYLVM